MSNKGLQKPPILKKVFDWHFRMKMVKSVTKTVTMCLVIKSCLIKKLILSLFMLTLQSCKFLSVCFLYPQLNRLRRASDPVHFHRFRYIYLSIQDACYAIWLIDFNNFARTNLIDKYLRPTLGSQLCCKSPGFHHPASPQRSLDDH